MDLFLYILDLAGTAVFAVTGALAAGRKRMDVFGVVVLGCVTALGGGTLRDVVLGIHPVFWIPHSEYLVVAVAASVGTFVLVRHRPLHSLALMHADALGLAVFTVIGFQKGFQCTQAYTVGVVMGVSTGVVGGMFRDVLAGEIPLILRREIYASASLCGASVFALLSMADMPDVAVVLSLLVTLFIRMAALHWNLSLPLFRLDGGNGDTKP